MDLTTIFTPLTSTTTQFKWNNEHEKAFYMINELLLNLKQKTALK